jgi:putative Holliday junction resolvase
MPAVRALGIDLGSKRIGVAVSDRSGTLASPLTTLTRSSSRRHDHQALRRLVVDEEVEVVVVGMPTSLDGSAGRAARAAATEARQLASVVGVPVETHDERFTTVTASAALRATGQDARRQRSSIDQAAAAVMLQGWLDRRRTIAATGTAAADGARDAADPGGASS